MLIMPGLCPGTGKIIAHGLQSPAGLFGLQTEGARKHVSAGKMPQRNATQRKDSPTDGDRRAGRPIGTIGHLPYKGRYQTNNNAKHYLLLFAPSKG